MKKNKSAVGRHILSILIVFVLIFTVIGLVGCAAAGARGQIFVTSEKKNVFAGETLQLAYKLQPKSLVSDGAVWSSSEPKIATVDQNGLLTGVAPGSVTVTAVVSSGNESFTGTVKICVQEKIQPESVKIVARSKYVSLDKRVMISADIQPDNTNDAEWIWESSDESIGKVVSYSGKSVLVYGVSNGIFNLTIKNSRNAAVADTISLEVTEPRIIEDYTDSNSLNGWSVDHFNGDHSSFSLRDGKFVITAQGNQGGTAVATVRKSFDIDIDKFPMFHLVCESAIPNGCYIELFQGTASLGKLFGNDYLIAGDTITDLRAFVKRNETTQKYGVQNIDFRIQFYNYAENAEIVFSAFESVAESK